MSMLGAGAGSAPVFDLNEENAHPAGLAFTNRGKGSIYVGNAEPGNVNPNERVYRYSTGGVLLNEYRPVNPLPIAGDRTSRGKIVSMTECGGYLAIVWNRAEAHPTDQNRRLNECSITWMPLGSAGEAQSIGVQTSQLFSNSVPQGGTATGPCLAPLRFNWPQRAIRPRALRPPSLLHVVARGGAWWIYSMNYTQAGVLNNDPRLNVAGAGGSPPTRAGRTRTGRATTAADRSSTRAIAIYEVLGLAATVPIECAVGSSQLTPSLLVRPASGNLSL